MSAPRSRAALHAALDCIQRRIEDMDATIEREYRPDQLRDELGRFAYEGGEGAGRGGADDPAHPKLRGPLPAPTAREVLGHQPEMLQSYRASKPSLVIPANVHEKLKAIGDDYTRETGRTMTVTSGTRTPLQQADATYHKLEDGSASDYTNKKALAEIKAEYDRGNRNGIGRQQTVEGMADVIKSQASKGVYISRHLVNGAADIQTRGLDRAGVAKLRSVIVRHGGHGLNEGNHLHVQFGR